MIYGLGRVYHFFFCLTKIKGMCKVEGEHTKKILSLYLDYGEAVISQTQGGILLYVLEES